MKDFRDLKVWEKAHAVTLRVYQLTKKFPREELYSLTSQMRRSASSVPMNIAEGCGRRGNAEFQRFLQIASGSASELEYQLLLAKDLGFISGPEYSTADRAVVEIKRMLAALISKVESERFNV